MAEDKENEIPEETVNEEAGKTIETADELDLEDIEATSVDLTPFQGKELKIDRITKMAVKSPYDEKGDYTPNKSRDVMVLKVETVPFTEIDTKDGKKAITASKIFNLKQNPDSGKWGVSTSDNSNLRQFMNKHKVTKVADLKGKFVIPVIGKKGYMEFA